MDEKEVLKKKITNHLEAYKFWQGVADQLEANLTSWGLEEGNPGRDSSLLNQCRSEGLAHLARAKQLDGTEAS